MFQYSEVEDMDKVQSSEVNRSGFSFSQVGKQPDLTKVGVQNVFSLDGRNTNAARKLNLINKNWFNKVIESSPAKFGDSMSKSAVRGLFDIGSGIGTLVEFYGDNMILQDGAFGLDNKTIYRLNTFGRGWQKAGQSIRKGADFVLNDEGVQFDKDIFAGTIVENPSVTRVSAAIMSALPSLMAMKATATATGSTGLAYFTMGAVDSSDVYNDAKEAGKSQEESNFLYGVSMGGTALIDRMLSPLEKVLGGKPTTIWKQLSKRITAGLSEGTAEASQTVWQNAIKKYGIADTQSLVEGVVEAAIGGFGSATAMSGTLGEANERLKAKGASEQEINAIVDVMGDYIQKHPDELNDIAFQQLEKGLSEFDKFVEANKGAPEVQKALQVKSELEQIHGEVTTLLKKNGIAPNIAEADAKIWQGIALFGSQETGLSPMEYFKQRAPNVKKESLANFLQRYDKNKKSKADGNLKLFEALVNNKIYKQLEKENLANQGESLLRFLKKTGGLKDVDGDLKAMDAGKSYVGLINNKSGVDLDDATLAAWENGYFSHTMERPSVQDLKDAIREELFGNKRYAYQEDKIPSIFDEVNELAQQMDILGIDYSGMTALEAQNAFDKAVGEYNREIKSSDDFDKISFQKVNNVNKADNLIDRSDKNKYLTDNEVKQVEKDNELFSKKVTALEKNELPKREQLVVLSRLPSAFKNIKELHGRRLFISQDVYKKIVDIPNKFDKNHNISRDRAIKLPELIADPNYILKSVSNGHEDRFVVVTRSRGNKPGMRLSVIIQPSTRDAVVSAYDENINISIEKKAGRVLFDKKKELKSEVSALNAKGLNNSVNSITQSNTDVNTFYQSAFHGTPSKELEGGHFSLEKINTGEGAQAHGHGLYFAMSYNVADNHYRKKLTTGYTSIKLDGKEYSGNTPEGLAYLSYKRMGDNVDETIKDYETSLKKNADLKGSFEYEFDKKSLEFLVKNKGRMSEIEETKNNGQVYEVDIPENPFMIDEQATFENQSPFVQEVFERISSDFGIQTKGDIQAGVNFHSVTGKYVYNKLAGKIGSSEKASKILHDYGIKGITYDGKRDGRCFVIFNPDDVKVIQKFYQNATKPKGAYIQNLDQKGVIYLFEQSDASTFMHETAHFFFKELQEFGTDRSKAMLHKVNDWADLEFDQRYKTKTESGGIVVVDKFGNVVYGDAKPFLNVKMARDYAKNELFARGFEQYLREGKSPNNYLKQAFRSFWNWLRHLYRTADELNVNINDDIRGIYGEIIGGKELDFYLSAQVDEVLQQHFEESKGRKVIYDEEIKLAQMQPSTRGFWTSVAQERTDGAKGRNKWWNKAIIPISTRAKRVNIRLKNKLRAYDYGVGAQLNQYYKQMKPFLDIWETFTETDAIAFDLALKNSYVEKQLEIVKKYNAYNEFVQVKNLLNNLFDQAVDVGIEMGYAADYFPRQIDDVEGFMKALYGSPFESQLRRALRNADPDNVMSNEQKAEFLNKYLRGFNRRDLNKPIIGNTKDRQIDIVTAEMNKYYKPSMQALINYVEGMNASIESRKFWGFKYDDIEQSIGSLTADLVDSGFITPEQDAEVQEILKARFKAKGVSNKWLSLQKNASYIYTMGGINSAITQLDDLSVSLYKAGFWNTVNSIFSPNKAGLSREELGLEKIGQEFVEASASSKAVSAVFKMTGLDKIDAFGKNTLINATFRKFQQMAVKNEDSLRSYLEPIMEQETDQTIEDIKVGNISENVKLLMFNELADMQPIALSEMPEWYLTSGNGRVFYMLKTFALKRIDIFRNECFDKMRNGDTKTGIQNLFKLSMFMMICGAGKDELINLLFGRKFNLSDTVVNNFLGLFGISKYALYKTRDEGFTGFLSSVGIPPVFAPASDLMSDIYKSLFSAKGKDISDFEAWKGVPITGRLYYWWFGGGRTKENRMNKKMKIKS